MVVRGRLPGVMIRRITQSEMPLLDEMNIVNKVAFHGSTVRDIADGRGLVCTNRKSAVCGSS